MALKREFLAALGIEDSKIQPIIDAHIETVDALKKERDTYKAEADKLPGVQAELEKAQAAAKDSGKYDKLKEEYDAYKAGVEKEKALEAKRAVLREIAKDAGLSEAGIAKAVKYHDFDSLELDEKGAAKGKAAILKGLQEEWSDYVQTTETKGANTATPPGSAAEGNKKMTKEEIAAIKDPTARQAAMVENHELYGY